MRMLEKASPRVKVYSIGKTEEGREMIAVAIASDAIMAKLQDNGARLAKLADPRTINMDDAQAETLVNASTPIYYITGTIHSPETGSPTALMELAYRLDRRRPRIHQVDPQQPDHADHAGDRSRRPQQDGRRLQVAPRAPGPELAGARLLGQVRRARQQPRRDGRHAQAHRERAQHLHAVASAGAARPARVGAVSLRQHGRRRSVQRLDRSDSRRRVADDRLEQRLGDDEVRHARRLHARQLRHLVAWLPDVHRRAAQRHQPAVRDVRQRRRRHGGAHRCQPNDYARTWYKQNPPLPKTMWSQRNNNNYQQTGLLTSLHYFAGNGQLFLRNFYTEEQALDPEGEAPKDLPPTCFTADDPRPGAQAELLRMLQKQGVEISRATAAFTVMVPGKKAPPQTDDDEQQWAGRAGWAGWAGKRWRTERAGRAGEAGRAGGAGQDTRRAGHAHVPRRLVHRPHGSAVQPHRRLADRLSVPGARTIRSARRTTTPAGHSPSCTTCRRSASPT